MNYSFMKPFSQNVEASTQRGDVISPVLAQKMDQTRISCTKIILGILSYGCFS